MYPGCRFMDLHPQERGQLSYAPHHGPGFGHVLPHMKMDTSRSPVNYESSPCYGSYGTCPYPLPYQGCYHNQSPPDYHGYGLHYPHYAPLPPVYCYGSYPPLPGSYPFQYLPSPHYSAVDPRYEYDKKGPADHHCCGCPNHLCQQKENKNVKIEEQTSDDEKDKVASLVPSELKDQYPVLWIPPGYTRNEGEQTIKPESKRESSSDKEAKGSLKPCAQEPGVRNGWLPINLNNLNSLVQGRNKKGTEHKQNEDSQSFFPVVGMPRNPEQKDKLELKEGDQKSIWDPSQYRIFPLKCIDNQDEKSMPEGDSGNYENSSSEDGPKAGDKKFVKKIIPVKQIDRSEEKGLLKDDQNKENRARRVEKNHSEMPLKHAGKKGEKKHLENNSNVQSSLSKASKFPPVCLRVDPLPSRRTKGDSSRSPSLPANKKKSEMVSHDKSSSSTMQGNNQQESSADSDLGGLQRGKEVKDIEVVDSTLRDNKIEAQKEDLSQSHVNASAGDSQEKVSNCCQDGKGVKCDLSAGGGVKSVDILSGEITKDDKLTIEAQSGDVNCETGVNGGPIDTKKSGLASTNKKFSEAEAAVTIQSVYRGFEVRRWETLKKLKEIARIEGELVKVRLDVQNLVSSGNGNIDKQKIVIGETIMNLLLQLDTMQGLHPSMRNIRKSVAKELVSLQEKLDSITSQSSEELKEPDVSKHAGEISNRASEEERQKAGEDRQEQDTTSPSHMKSGVAELCQDQSHTLVDANISSVDIENSELMSGTDEMGRAFEEKQPDFSAYVDLKGRHPEPPVEVKEPSEVHGVHEDRDSSLVESKELPPSVIAEEKLNPVVQLQNLSSLLDSDWSSKEDEVANVNTEVPFRVPEQNFNAQVSGEGLQIDGGRCIVEQGKLELVQESGLISARETSAEEQGHTKLLAESLKLSDPEDNIATAVCSEGSSELKDNVCAEGDSERDKELSGDDMLRTEFVEASNEKHVNNMKGEANVCVVEGDDKSIDDMWTAAVRVDTKGIPDMKEVANACELEGEGDDKPVDDMHTADSVGVETKETLDMKEAVNVCEVEGEYKPADDRQTADTVGLEHRETPEVNEFLKDVGPVEDVESIETCGPELEDLSKATSDIQLKQQKPSFVKDTASGKEAHMEEIANCNSEQKMAVDDDQETWEDKFDNKEIYHKCSNGNITDLPGDENLVEEDLAPEKINKQPHGEFSTGKGDCAVEGLFAEEPRKEVPASLPVSGQISSGTGKESDNELVEENEKLKETVEKLIAAGKEQLTAISSLSERVKDLEKKLSRKKKLKMRRHKSPSRYLLQV